ncbi:MAG: SdpI family protein [Halorhabdus sp.]
MDSRQRTLLGVGLAALTAGVGIAFRNQLPAQVAIHFGPSGYPDNWVAKPIALALLPVLQVVMVGFFAAIPRIDPLGENIREFRQAYNAFVLLIIGFLGYVHTLLIVWNAGYNFAMSQALVPAVAVLYYVAGTVMEHAEQNWFIGIRTPWTLSNEQVWAHTHSLAGTLMKVVAVVALGGLLFPSYAVAFLAVPAALVAAIATIYSYWDYRHTTRHST